MNRMALALLISLISISSTNAAEKLVVCAKYQIKSGWSESYRVKATILKGSELNQMTRNSSYNGLATYVVIPWEKDQTSVIEMSWPELTIFGQEGLDQLGRKWEVSKNSLC